MRQTVASPGHGDRPVKLCRVPGCGAKLYSGNRNGVCRAHNHRKPHCLCVQCTGIVPEYRVKTRPEMVQEGLLPGPALTEKRGKGISLPPKPWRDE